MVAALFEMKETREENKGGRMTIFNVLSLSAEKQASLLYVGSDVNSISRLLCVHVGTSLFLRDQFKSSFIA